MSLARLPLFLGVICGACIGIGGLVISFCPAEEEGRGRKGKGDKVVHDMMEKVHEGKNSPWRRLQKSVAADAVDWAALKDALPRVNSMAKALAESKVEAIKESSQSYVDAVKNLTAAAQKQDAAAAKKGITSLKNACSDCHSKGGIGGRLEHEDEEREGRGRGR